MLVDISKKNIMVDLKYYTTDNVTGRPLHDKPLCYLHEKAIPHLDEAIQRAAQLGYLFKVFDAYRPQSVQQALWDFCPDPMYVADPIKGSNHTRGIAIDLTLVTINEGVELDMGTPFDDFTTKSHHKSLEISPEVARNRYILLGIMMSAGWDLYLNEWWHYQLFNPSTYDLIPSI